MTTHLHRHARPGLRDALAPRLRQLVETVTAPYPTSDYLDLVAPVRRGGPLRARVVEVRPETADAATVVLRPNADWVAHTPGQYLRIGVDIDGVRQWRTYSVTSLPVTGGERLVTFTVKAIAGGSVSHHLVRALRPGTVVELGQATGEFVLPETLPAHVLFVTGGSGITPVMGMLRSLAQRRGQDPAYVHPDIVMIHSALRPDDVIFGAELQRYAAEGLIRLTLLHTDTDGMLDAGRLRALVPDLASRHAWVCGPAGLLDLAESMAPEMAGLTVERFRPVLAEPGEGGTARFTRSDVEAEVDGSTSLLEAGEAAGIDMPHGCRIGICHRCVVSLTDGAVRDMRTGEVVLAEEGVAIQTCISSAAGRCAVDV